MEPVTDNLAPYHPGGLSSHRGSGPSSGGAGLLDVLDRVLDKGVVIAGDIRINLLDIELLTIKVRLLISSADKAKEMGIDWWARDPHLSGKSSESQQQSGKKLNSDAERENKALRERVERLEAQLKSLTERNGSSGAGHRLPHASGAGAGSGNRRG